MSENYWIGFRLYKCNKVSHLLVVGLEILRWEKVIGDEFEKSGDCARLSRLLLVMNGFCVESCSLNNTDNGHLSFAKHFVKVKLSFSLWVYINVNRNRCKFRFRFIGDIVSSWNLIFPRNENNNNLRYRYSKFLLRFHSNILLDKKRKLIESRIEGKTE